MELDAQTVEKTPVDKQEQDDGNKAIISPISEQKEKEEFLVQEVDKLMNKDDEIGMDTVSK